MFIFISLNQKFNTGQVNYCFCLCFGLEQIILKCLALFTILQLSQIFFTADFIFIKISSKILFWHNIKEKQGKNPYFSTL